MSVAEGRLAPIRTPIGSEPEKATIQLLHQTWRSRIDRLNEAAVAGGSSGTYGAQQRFSASTRSPMSSVRQKRYALTFTPALSSVAQTTKASRPSRRRRKQELLDLRVRREATFGVDDELNRASV